MDFTGTGARLTEADIGIAAQRLGVSPAHIKTVLKVETRGHGFGPRKRPVILFEPHIFDRMLRRTPGTEDELQARREGLAHPRWHAVPYVGGNDGNYRHLVRAMRICRDAALKSCSWGLGQIMGFNHRKAGFATAEAMVEAMKRGEGEQLLSMCAFIEASRLAPALRRAGDTARSWEAFCRGYNGAGFRKNSYHIKAAYWFKRYSGDPLNVATNARQAAMGATGGIGFGGGAEGADVLAGALDMSRELAWYVDFAKWVFAALAVISLGLTLWGLGRVAWKRWASKGAPDERRAQF